jgi:hypothetical protein
MHHFNFSNIVGDWSDVDPDCPAMFRDQFKERLSHFPKPQYEDIFIRPHSIGPHFYVATTMGSNSHHRPWRRGVF